MFFKDARIPNSLNKQQHVALEKEVKPTILTMFNLTKESTKTKEKRATLIAILSTLQQYLGDNNTLLPNNLNYHVSTHKTHTVISQINKELKHNLLTVTGFEVTSMVILSTSTVLEAFEEALGYLGQFKPQLEPSGNIYYIVRLNNSDTDFVLYRFSLDVLEKQFHTLADAQII